MVFGRHFYDPTDAVIKTLRECCFSKYVFVRSKGHLLTFNKILKDLL